MNTALYPRPSHVPASNAADIDIYALPGSETDLHAAWKQLQTDQSPEFLWTPHNGGHWIVTLGHHIKQILLDHTRFSNAPLFNPGAKTEHFKLLPLHADQPEHAQYRNAVVLEEMLFMGIQGIVIRRGQGDALQAQCPHCHDQGRRGRHRRHAAGLGGHDGRARRRRRSGRSGG